MYDRGKCMIEGNMEKCELEEETKQGLGESKNLPAECFRVTVPLRKTSAFVNSAPRAPRVGAMLTRACTVSLFRLLTFLHSQFHPQLRRSVGSKLSKSSYMV
ncbi:hypothetical protein NPIL_646601 [Nephila pilipes]|uniref:Uncharacterized protein n=1 Tax=Nephila pilipes TaxID=299642 RepID=A0A8X6QUJ3_NEPPI|nr:hypothetical protein NPIL_646601 [Nephila pilipes]